MLRTTTLRKVLLIGLLTFLITSQAGTVSAGTNVWTSNGPEGGVIYSLAIDPATPSTLYAGTDGDGVYKSTNSGGSWSEANIGLPTNTTVNALAIVPLTPTTLFAGTSGGLFKSTNDGASWGLVNTHLGAVVYDLAFDPTTPSTIYAGTMNGGVFKSTNGGEDWSAVNTGLPTNSTVLALAIDPLTPTTLYAGGWGGVFKSIDSGGNWNSFNIGLNGNALWSLAIDPITPSTLYAGTDSGGLFKTTDSGENWTAFNEGLTGSVVSSLAIDPTTPSTLYAGRMGGVFKSTNGGGNWSAFNNGLTNTFVYALAFDPTIPNTLYAGTFSGVFAIQQIQGPALLTINYSSGAPGSYFTITGSNYPPDSTATITVNGNVLGTVPTDSSGSFIFILETSPTTDEGFYSVRVTVNPSATTQFTLDVDDVVRAQEGSGTVLEVPDGIVYHFVYLPLIVK